ncbi:LPXTG cell wall anchor domain-containing protein [Lacticaseibacillus porcinae]|uniref:LPXTG cell wall anchor domain-containing protein n=1 Tax=Lacticaseibacillus porcinae TaxID=1123687 RepID=UPI000F790E3F|nr:LPXTG cell wall anchor domain-containing protein [Lacticaseibacillus porcinae]
MKKSTLKKTAFTVAAGAALFAPAILGSQSVSAASEPPIIYNDDGTVNWDATDQAAIKWGDDNQKATDKADGVDDITKSDEWNDTEAGSTAAQQGKTTTDGDYVPSYDWVTGANELIDQANANAIKYDQENNTINGAQTMTDPNASYTTNADGSQTVESTTPSSTTNTTTTTPTETTSTSTTAPAQSNDAAKATESNTNQATDESDTSSQATDDYQPGAPADPNTATGVYVNNEGGITTAISKDADGNTNTMIDDLNNGVTTYTITDPQGNVISKTITSDATGEPVELNADGSIKSSPADPNTSTGVFVKNDGTDAGSTSITGDTTDTNAQTGDNKTSTTSTDKDATTKSKDAKSGATKGAEAKATASNLAAKAGTSTTAAVAEAADKTATKSTAAMPTTGDDVNVALSAAGVGLIAAMGAFFGFKRRRA